MTVSGIFLSLLVMTLTGFMVKAMGRAEMRLGSGREMRAKRQWAVLVAICAWLLVTGLAADEGLLLDFEALVPPIAQILAPGFVLIFAVAFSSLGARLAQGVTYPELIRFQLLRIPLDLILFGYSLDGRISPRATFMGYSFDILFGIFAFALLPFLTKGKLRRYLIGSWNVLGLVLWGQLLFNILLSTPGKWNLFEGEMVNTLPFSCPSVWIFFALLSLLLGQLILLRRLLRPQPY